MINWSRSASPSHGLERRAKGVFLSLHICIHQERLGIIGPELSEGLEEKCREGSV